MHFELIGLKVIPSEERLKCSAAEEFKAALTFNLDDSINNQSIAHPLTHYHSPVSAGIEAHSLHILTLLLNRFCSNSDLLCSPFGMETSVDVALRNFGNKKTLGAALNSMLQL